MPGATDGLGRCFEHPIEGVSGVLYLAVLIARIVGIYARRAPDQE